MAGIVEFEDDAGGEVLEKSIPVASSPVVEGIVIDTKYMPKDNILMHVEGSSWLVNYYSQVLNKSNAPAGQLVNRNPIYQQYKLIEGFEFKVTSPLTTSQDTETKEFSVVGTATIYPFVIPNEGDIFIADIGEARSAIFKITSSERKSIFKDTCYVVEYVLIDYTTAERLGDLNKKVIDTLVYKKDFLEYGQSPLITRKENDLVTNLEMHFGDIINVYFRLFLSTEYKTLIVPGQDYVIYDPFLVNAVRRHFNSWDCPSVAKVKILNADGDSNLQTPQLWEMISRLDKRLLNYVANQAGLMSAKLFTKSPLMEGIYHSGVDFVVYPKNPILDVDNERIGLVKPLSDEVIKRVPPRTNLPDMAPLYNGECEFCDFHIDLEKIYEASRDNKPLPPNVTPIDHLPDFSDILDTAEHVGVIIPDIHPVNLDGFYVFTSSFYRQRTGLQPPGMSRLEVAVCQMLARKPVDLALLNYFCETYHSWGAVERFYYIPILLILIKYSIRSI